MNFSKEYCVFKVYTLFFVQDLSQTKSFQADEIFDFIYDNPSTPIIRNNLQDETAIMYSNFQPLNPQYTYRKYQCYAICFVLLQATKMYLTLSVKCMCYVRILWIVIVPRLTSR